MSISEFRALPKTLLASEEDDKDNYAKVRKQYGHLRFFQILDLGDMFLYATQDRKYMIFNECGTRSIYKMKINES